MCKGRVRLWLSQLVMLKRGQLSGSDIRRWKCDVNSCTAGTYLKTDSDIQCGPYVSNCNSDHCFLRFASELQHLSLYYSPLSCVTAGSNSRHCHLQTHEHQTVEKCVVHGLQSVEKCVGHGRDVVVLNKDWKHALLQLALLQIVSKACTSSTHLLQAPFHLQ